MATMRQCKMLAAKSMAAKVKYDWDVFKALENGEVTKRADELDALLEQKVKVPEAETVEPKKELNGFRFGMCVKLVIDNISLEFFMENTDEFKDRVIKLYKVITEIEAAVEVASVVA